MLKTFGKGGGWDSSTVLLLQYAGWGSGARCRSHRVHRMEASKMNNRLLYE